MNAGGPVPVGTGPPAAGPGDLLVPVNNDLGGYRGRGHSRLSCI